MGRFLTPDAYGGSGKPVHPQTWNRYADVIDDPLNKIDPLGLDDYDLDGQPFDRRDPRNVNPADRGVTVYSGGGQDSLAAGVLAVGAREELTPHP